MRIFLILALLCIPAYAQTGKQGEGHDYWHQDFYQKLVTPRTKVSCCNLADCRPTQGRQVGDHWEVMVNGAWIRVLEDKIVSVGAPDGGYHVCAPAAFDGDPQHVYCVVLPPEG